MAGIMDMFGGGDIYGDLLTDEQKQRMQQQTMMTMAAKLLQAGGPSTTPTNLGQALGGAFLSGQEAYGKAGQNALQGMLTKQKIEEYRRGQQTQQAIQDILSGGVNQAAALSAQPSAPQRTPRGARAGMPQGASAGMPQGAQAGVQQNNAMQMASKYRQIGAALAATDVSKANQYFAMADKTMAANAPVGQPFEVQDPSNPNQNILVQRMPGGGIEPVQGFSPAGMSEQQRQQMALSQAQLQLAQQSGIRDAARLGLSQAEFARGGYTLQQTSDGFAYVPKMPGMPVIPAVSGAPVNQPADAATSSAAPKQLKPAGAKPTEQQSNAAGFTQRMELAQGILSQQEASGNYPGMGSAAAGAIPLVGGLAKRVVQDPNTQMYQQAANDWIRAKLRKESGAAIPPEEMDQEYETYFPMPGNSSEVVAQKAEARRVATLAMQKAAGDFYEPYKPLGVASPAASGETPEQRKARLNKALGY